MWPTIEKDGTLFGLRLKQETIVAHEGARLTKASNSMDGKDADQKDFQSLFVANFLDGSRAVVDQGKIFRSSRMAMELYA